MSDFQVTNCPAKNPQKATSSFRLRHGESKSAFTLVELMVSMALLTLVMLVTLNIVNYTRSIYKSTTAKISAFRESRAAFSAITQRVGLATLNPYFDYVDANGKTRSEVEASAGVFTPASYVRQSELHFVCGQAANLVPSLSGRQHPGHAIFFQAPLGFTSTPSKGDAQLSSLLNAVGYYVEYGSNSAWLPSFLTGITPPKNRYRLMQMVQNTERLSVYSTAMTSANRFDWFKTPIATPVSGVAPPARPIAENILAAVIWPQIATNDNGGPISDLDYGYDSKAYLAGSATKSRNQLPPYVQVTLVAIDEASAARLDQKYPSGAPLLQPGALFNQASDPAGTPPSKLDQDLATLVAFLQAEKYDYRVFTTKVLIRQAKYSAN